MSHSDICYEYIFGSHVLLSPDGERWATYSPLFNMWAIRSVRYFVGLAEWVDESTAVNFVAEGILL